MGIPYGHAVHPDKEKCSMDFASKFRDFNETLILYLIHTPAQKSIKLINTSLFAISVIIFSQAQLLSLFLLKH